MWQYFKAISFEMVVCLIVSSQARKSMKRQNKVKIEKQYNDDSKLSIFRAKEWVKKDEDSKLQWYFVIQNEVSTLSFRKDCWSKPWPTTITSYTMCNVYYYILNMRKYTYMYRSYRIERWMHISPHIWWVHTNLYKCTNDRKCVVAV